MYAQWKNDSFSTLAGALTQFSTSLTVAAGHGDRFPIIAAPNYMMLTLQDASGGVERVKVTARAGVSDSMTIERAQEGTVAREWSIGDAVSLRLSADFINKLVTKNDPETLTNKTLNDSFAATPPAGNSSAALATTEFVAMAVAAAVATAVATTKDVLYPIGSIYTNAASAVNPATLLGFGTWEAFGVGRVLVGLDGADTSFDTLGLTGGAKDAVAVGHSHAFTATSGGQSGDHGHSISDPGHAHAITEIPGPTLGADGSIDGSMHVTATDRNYVTRDSAPTVTGVTVGGTTDDHTHDVTGTTDVTGVDGTNKNLQPYVVVNMWKRVA